MTALQDGFHSKVAKKFGLERGVRGSKAEHETIAEYYARVNAKVPACPSRASLLLMNDEDRLEMMKTLHAQAAESVAKLDKLEDERKQHAQKIEGLEYMLEQKKADEDLMRKAVARLIKNTYTPAEFARVMGVEIKGKADIFDTMVKVGEATGFAHAVALVAAKMPPKGGHSWEDLASFVTDLDKPVKPVPAAPVEVQAKRPKL
jgi:hypothetical protein